MQYCYYKKMETNALSDIFRYFKKRLFNSVFRFGFVIAKCEHFETLFSTEKSFFSFLKTWLLIAYPQHIRVTCVGQKKHTDISNDFQWK